MADEWDEIAKKYFPIAYRIGIESAIMILGTAATTSGKEYEKIINERYEWNNKYVRVSLIKRIRDDLGTIRVKAMKVSNAVETPEELEEEVEKSFATQAFSIGLYAGAVLGVASKAENKEVRNSIISTQQFWINTSGNECKDCIALQANNPYNPGELTVLPGDGATECNGHCWCQLQESLLLIRFRYDKQ